MENLVTRQAVSPTVIDTISIHEHAADKSYSYAVASLSLNRIGVDDGKTYPLVGLNDGCDGINTSRYFYEIYKDGVTSGAAVLGEGRTAAKTAPCGSATCPCAPDGSPATAPGPTPWRFPPPRIR